MSKKPAKKKRGGTKVLRTSLKACYFRLFLGVALLICGGLMLLSAILPEGQSLALNGVGRLLYGLGGGSLALFLPLWMIAMALLLLSGMFHRVNMRPVLLLGVIWVLLLGFLTLVTFVDPNGGQNVMSYYRDRLSGSPSGTPGLADYLKISYEYGADSRYCQGALGMLAAYPIWCFFRFSHIGGSVVLCLAILVLLLVLFNLRPWRAINAISYKLADRRMGGRSVPGEGEMDGAGFLPEDGSDPDGAVPAAAQDTWDPQAAVSGVSGGRYSAPAGDGWFSQTQQHAMPAPGAEDGSLRRPVHGADEDGYYVVSGDSPYNEYFPDPAGSAGAAPSRPAAVLPDDRLGRSWDRSEAGVSPEEESPDDTVKPRKFGRGGGTASPKQNDAGDALQENKPITRTGTQENKPFARTVVREEKPIADTAPQEEKPDPRTAAQDTGTPVRARTAADRKEAEQSGEKPSGKTSWLDQVRSREKRLKEEPADSQKTDQVVNGGAVPVTTDGVLESDLRVSVRGNARNTGSGSSLDGMERGQVSDLKIDTRSMVEYHYPPITLLNPGVDFNTLDHSQEDSQKAVQIEETLKSFNIPAEVKRIMHGPAITRFAIQIAPGIRVQKVTGMADNLALNLATRHVRVEAPIQGTNYIGIEVPNRKISTVSLREVLESEQMRQNKSPLAVSLGKDIAGFPVVCDLSRMPHLLIAGATGSGKSVCIHSIVCSLLYRSSPQEVRLIMIDPKQVELSVYNGVPHLLIPVVTDVRKASGALGWAVQEMQDRYAKFTREGVRNMEGYNRNHVSDGMKLPNIVIIIDEMADLMDVCRKDVEEYIRRLAALARAAGIYMVLATQRPSVDVITGVIKNNIPSRIAFAVSSGTDSRTILDTFGAEKLMGKGDMLYKPSGMTANRVQGSFVSDDEVMGFVEYIRSHHTAEYDPDIMEHLQKAGSKSGDQGSMDMSDGGEDDGEGDGRPEGLLQEAIQMAIEDGQTSTSMLQRRLRIGYARAGRLVDEMEKRGVVSAQDGSKPRKTLITREQYYEMFSDDAAGE